MCATLTIFGLPLESKHESISYLFGQFGTITRLVLSHNKAGTFNGVAFVTFQDKCSADYALEQMNDFRFDDKSIIKVEYSHFNDPRNSPLKFIKSKEVEQEIEKIDEKPEESTDNHDMKVSHIEKVYKHCQHNSIRERSRNGRLKRRNDYGDYNNDENEDKHQKRIRYGYPRQKVHDYVERDHERYNHKSQNEVLPKFTPAYFQIMPILPTIYYPNPLNLQAFSSC